MHVDFLRVSGNTLVNVEIPVHFENEEKSDIKIGGVLNIVRHTVEFHCPANDIPEAITVDLSGLKIGATAFTSRTSSCRRTSRLLSLTVTSRSQRSLLRQLALKKKPHLKSFRGIISGRKACRYKIGPVPVSERPFSFYEL